MNTNFNKEIAECVGLWLAEGDTKTKREVTFTNNCLELVLFFQKNIEKLYKGNNKPRLYIYSPSNIKLISNLNKLKIKHYIDTRANRTYFIYRIADTKFIKEWKQIVNEIKDKKEFYPEILRGIFAGEGNIHHKLYPHPNRTVRISCKTKNKLIDKILNHFNVKYKFNISHREYSMCGINLDKLNKINIASLHPEKEHKFNKMISSIKQKHYPTNYLKKAIYSKLDKLYTANELAIYFDRDKTRIQELLADLKKENKIIYTRTKGKSLWAKNDAIEKFLINQKLNLLKYLDLTKTIVELCRNIGLSSKTIRRRLKTLEKEDLVEKKKGRWNITEKGKLICGIDEAGNKV